MVVGLFVVYRMALFEHRVLFDTGVAVDVDNGVGADAGTAA